MSRSWHVYGTVCVSFVSVTNSLHVQGMETFPTVIQSWLRDLADAGLPYFQQNTVQGPHRIKKHPHVLVWSLPEALGQFLQGSWVRWKDNGIVLHNEFQALENKRVERGRAHTISVMNVQIRAPSAKPERHPQFHARRNVAPGVFALSAVSLHECPYFL